MAAMQERGTGNALPRGSRLRRIPFPSEPARAIIRPGTGGCNACRTRTTSNSNG
jgi:hypothetical protein